MYLRIVGMFPPSLHLTIEHHSLKNFHINHRDFTRTELEEYCWQQVNDAQEWERNHFAFVLQWLSDSNVLKTHTSGSTGAPKQIEMSRAMMEASARLTIDYFKLKRGTKALLALPSNFIGGKMMIARALLGGWHLQWIEPRSNPLSELKEEFDFAAFTPMQVSAILASNKDKFNAIKKVIVGGGAISDQLEKAIGECTNEVYATYGMTETITHVAVRPLTGKNAGSTFNALPGVRFSTSENNCLIIEAMHLGSQKIVTNDIVQLSSPLTFHFLGRADNVINSGGIKLFPEKIEEKIAHLLDRNFFIAKGADDVLGEKAIMYVEGELMNDSEKLQLISTMKLYLQHYEIPKEIRFMIAFERTLTGKIIRKNY